MGSSPLAAWLSEATKGEQTEKKKTSKSVCKKRARIKKTASKRPTKKEARKKRDSKIWAKLGKPKVGKGTTTTKDGASSRKKMATNRPTKEEAGRKAKVRFDKAQAANINLGRRCGSGRTRCFQLSCYSCRAKDQRWFTRRFYKPLKGALRRQPGSWEFLTIAPSYGRTPVGSEPKGGLPGFKAKVARDMRAADSALSAVCYIDLSLNIDLEGRRYWQWHVHAVTTKLSEEARQLLWRSCQWHRPGIPVMCKPIYNSKGILEYISKPDFFQRKDVVDRESGKRDTQKRSMTLQDELRVAQLVARYSVTRRKFQASGLIGRIFQVRAPLDRMRKG